MNSWSPDGIKMSRYYDLVFDSEETFAVNNADIFPFYLECTWLGVSEIMGKILTYHLEITLTIPMYNH